MRVQRFGSNCIPNYKQPRVKRYRAGTERERYERIAQNQTCADVLYHANAALTQILCAVLQWKRFGNGYIIQIAPVLMKLSSFFISVML